MDIIAKFRVMLEAFHSGLTGTTLHEPKAHAASHVAGDAIQSATAAQAGLATAAQITKLDGIEALADVTDAGNVSGAGAIMGTLLTEQGDVIYASAASTPAALAHGNAGEVLTSGGHGANPSWEAGGSGGESGPVGNNMLTDAPTAVGAGTWTRIATGIIYYGEMVNLSNANADNFSTTLRVPVTGTYVLRFNAAKAANRAIVDVDLDGVEIGSFDLYGAADYTYVVEIAGLAIDAGARVFRFRVDGRNASATHWYFGTAGIILRRTA